MVLQYANSGNLKEYLDSKFDSLQWKDKIKMALDITRGLMYLHQKKIIHRDLVNNLILFTFFLLKLLIFCFQSTLKIY